MTKLKVTLVKSTIKSSVKQKATVQALGLKKVRSSVEQLDNVQMNGMLKKVAHLIKVEKI